MVMKKNIFIFLGILNFIQYILCEQILIITTAYNRPEFIEIQYKSFKKFLKNDFKYVVFNDARDENYKDNIKIECKKFNIDCYDVPNAVHAPKWPGMDISALGGAAIRHGEALRFALEVFDYYRNGIIAIIDSDCFITNNFNIEEYLGDNAMTWLYNIPSNLDPLPLNSPKRSLFSPILSFFNMKKLSYPESMIIEAGFIGNHFKDPFHMLGYYLFQHPELHIKKMECEHLFTLASKSDLDLKNRGYNDKHIKFISDYKKLFADHYEDYNNGAYIFTYFIENSFLHIGGGTREEKFQKHRYDLFCNFIKSQYGE